MKITRSGEKAEFFRQNKAKANAGCNVCPCCGETKSVMEYFSYGITNSGISSGTHKCWCEGFFRIKHMKVDCYSCKTCGAKWESEPYEYA